MAKPEKSQGSRAARVADGIRAELMDLLLRGEVRDPDAKGVMISGVKLTDDLRSARVMVRIVDGTEPDEARRTRAVKALTRASGFLRGAIGRKLALRFAPELHFHWDEGVDHALRLETLLDEIKREGKG
jgi:ribosome-binding factor A